MFTKREDTTELKNYSEVVDYFRADAVKDFTVTENNYITMSVYDKAEIEKIKNGAEDAKPIEQLDTKTVGFQLQSLELFINDCGTYYADKNNPNTNLVSYNIDPPLVLPWWVSLLPYAILIIAGIVIWIIVMKNANGGAAGKINSFGKARVKTPQDDKTRLYLLTLPVQMRKKKSSARSLTFLKLPISLRTSAQKYLTACFS